MLNSGKPTQSTEPFNRDSGRWVAGIFYVNSENPRLLVPKRFGGGWTFNFAHPIAWVLMAGLLALINLIFVGALLLQHILH